MKVFLFNGPPRSGKDAAAVWATQEHGGVFEKFARPLKTAFHGAFGGEMDEWLNNEPFESTKDDVIPWLGVSYRQWQIDFSEKFMRPMYGADIFGRLLASRIEQYAPHSYETVFVSDSGFAAEAEVLKKKFGDDRILLIRTHRPGYDFKIDSRSYLYGVVKHEVDVVNDSSLEEYLGKVKAIVNEFLER